MERIYEYKELRGALASSADDEYRKFSMKGIPSERPFIGVRIPLIREIVTKVSSEKIAKFLAVEPVTIEEVLARGILYTHGDSVAGCRVLYQISRGDFSIHEGVEASEVDVQQNDFEDL